MLGRMFDGIEYRGFAQDAVETLARYAGVPVWNGLTDQWHPTQMLADILTMRDHADQAARPGRLLLPGRRPQQHGQLAPGHRGPAGHGRPHRRPRGRCWPIAEVRAIAQRPGRAARVPASRSATDVDERGARGPTSSTPTSGCRWASPPSDWEHRIDQLLPYQVNAAAHGGHRQPGGQVHALPSGAAQHRHRPRPPARTTSGASTRWRSPTRSSSRRPRSSSTRRRTASTPSRRPWSPPSAD